jgi:thymidine phosphorylase
MEAPLGRGIGNALEVAEAVEVLQGGGPADLREVCLAVAREMLALVGIDEDPEPALADGRALEVWRRMVSAQGGDPDAPLPEAELTETVQAERAGYLTRIDALAVGTAAWRLGAGRARKEDAVDPSAGVVLTAGLGDRVEAGAPLAVLHAGSPERLAAGRDALAGAYDIADRPVATAPLVLEKVG